jgi:hypothetical protein
MLIVNKLYIGLKAKQVYLIVEMKLLKNGSVS